MQQGGQGTATASLPCVFQNTPAQMECKLKGDPQGTSDPEVRTRSLAADAADGILVHVRQKVTAKGIRRSECDVDLCAASLLHFIELGFTFQHES